MKWAPPLQSQPSPVLGARLELPITYLLGLATVLCTHRHHPGSRHSPGPRVEGVGKQDGQVGVTSSIVVVVPRVVDGFLGGPNHCRGTGKGQSRVSRGAEATLPHIAATPFLSHIPTTHSTTAALSIRMFWVSLPVPALTPASDVAFYQPRVWSPLSRLMLGRGQALPIPSRARTHVTCW